MLNVKEVWTVDQKTFSDLEFPFHVAIRTHDGKTFQSIGFERLERADDLMFKVMDSGRASERNFRECNPYGLDVFEP